MHAVYDAYLLAMINRRVYSLSRYVKEQKGGLLSEAMGNAKYFHSVLDRILYRNADCLYMNFQFQDRLVESTQECHTCSIIRVIQYHHQPPLSPRPRIWIPLLPPLIPILLIRLRPPRLPFNPPPLLSHRRKTLPPLPLPFPLPLPLPTPPNPLHRLQPPNRLLQRLFPALPKPRHLRHIPRRDLSYAPRLGLPFPHEGFGRHGKTHVARAVDEFKDGGGGLVVVAVDGFDAEDAGVAAGAVEVAGAEGGEEGWEVF